MNDVNMVVLSGRLTDLPHSSATPSGTQVVEFSVAVNRHGKNGDDVSFIGVTCFGKLGGLCAQYLGKGSPVLVTGSLKQEKWQDRQTGQNRSIVKVIASDVRFLDIPGMDNQELSTPYAPPMQQPVMPPPMQPIPQQMRYARSDMYPQGQQQTPPPRQQFIQGDGFGTPVTTQPPSPAQVPPPPDADLPF